MPLLFSYGTLQDPAVQRANFGRELDGRRDRLPGYAAELLEVADPDVPPSHHPVVRHTGDDADGVDGTVFDVTEDELAVADRYEIDDHHRILVSLGSGVRAWVYVAA
ncbi:gamma-glutamylcyclotransferase family protein [Catenuloplanes atrovinosus]|uniref:Gamma-glutamylcyclotransferase AIG2-like domain-containing protein n=1 Tax=Catenuloplanes atrovinosus TaxID=137266 RepID=A0AAE3YRB9_9ACTN|nr:gamma-glutamylcyclotransferase family protein [Catenuloplanes atrovinosus]MDR7278434.1 hypothetical protein [Catenuloplanes atrovinosus]